MSYTVVIPPGAATPENPAWHEARRAGVSASEIAAVLGISPWESPFSLYWRKVNGWEVDETEEMSTGRYAEPAIAAWAADTIDPNENLAFATAGLYASVERPWQLATPDRLVCEPCMHCGGAGVLGEFGSGVTKCSCYPMGVGPPLAVLECKWTGRWDGWGEPETDDIPVYYRTQVLQQCDVLDVEDWYMPVLGPGGFRLYRGRRDPKDIRVMRAAGATFARRLAAQDAPDIDSHTATVDTQKRLHSLGEGDIEVPVELAEGYRRARALRSRIEKRVDGYEARIRELLGNEYARAVCGVNAKGAPRLVASRSIYEQSTDQAELTALEGDWPVVDRLNPGRAASYA
jgi:putative phage-type endonuclease